MKSLEIMPLLSETDPAWVDVALSDFDAFLLDHAACERKASASAMSFVGKYPDKPQIIEPMICLAREELAHFHEVYCLIAKRGLTLASDTRDPYLQQLLPNVRTGKDDHFLDKMLVSAVVEARSCERLKLVSDALVDPELKDFYVRLARAEAGHFMVFIRCARHFFAEDQIQRRLDEFLAIEAKIVAQLAHRPAVH